MVGKKQLASDEKGLVGEYSLSAASGSMERVAFWIPGGSSNQPGPEYFLRNTMLKDNGITQLPRDLLPLHWSDAWREQGLKTVAFAANGNFCFVGQGLQH